MSNILLDIKYDFVDQHRAFDEIFAGHGLYDWNNARPGKLDDLDYLICWKHDYGLPAKMPDLKVVFSLGAGVDHILADPELPDVPIVRFVDPTLTARMSEWVVLQALMHLRQQRLYDDQQARHQWIEHAQPEAREFTIGVMGLGVLGQDASRKLATMGFRVIGWSRSKKSIDGLTCFGDKELDEFLGQCDILVGLLPHTTETTGLYNRALFKKLSRRGPFGAPIFINAGRGKSQVEANIVEALEDGTLYGASLDVFEKEPLPEDSPLWDMPRTILTPHMAANSDIYALARHIKKQIDRFERGEALQFVVDPKAGY